MNVLFTVLATVAIHLCILYKDVEGVLRRRHIIIENRQDCRVAANFRTLFDEFHNELRRKVAGGTPINHQYFQKQLMYGLIYDCELEMKAANETQNPGSSKGYGVVSFTREYEGSVLKAVKDGLEAVLQDKTALSQLIHPKSTRFGCSGSLNHGNGPRRIQVACVYDKKADPSSYSSNITKGACDNDADCTYYEGSKCLCDLCYAMNFS